MCVIAEMNVSVTNLKLKLLYFAIIINDSFKFSSAKFTLGVKLFQG